MRSSAALRLEVAAAPGGRDGTGVPDELRRDLRLIADMIEPGTRVLDIGCGDGALLAYLAREKSVDARGIELEPIRRQRLRAARPVGDPGRRRQRPRRLSRTTRSTSSC